MLETPRQRWIEDLKEDPEPEEATIIHTADETLEEDAIDRLMRL